jgi:hypothetical protein
MLHVYLQFLFRKTNLIAAAYFVPVFSECVTCYFIVAGNKTVRNKFMVIGYEKEMITS